jgi:hypothetical protein
VFSLGIQWLRIKLSGLWGGIAEQQAKPRGSSFEELAARA